MWRLLVVCLAVPLVAGCAALFQGHGSAPAIVRSESPISAEVKAKAGASRTSPASKGAAVPKVLAFGLIAGKTDFRGLLKAPYVRLTISGRDDPLKQIFFYIGSKGNQSVIPWGEEKVVEPGYFVLQLRPGAYQVTHIAIPVGSTIAEESLELDFDVAAGRVIYVGTLDVDGTEERLKFGGVPLVKPGFKYRLQVKDEMAEAKDFLKGMLPAGMVWGGKGLFAVVSTTDGELPPNEALTPGVRK